MKNSCYQHIGSMLILASFPSHQAIIFDYLRLYHKLPFEVNFMVKLKLKITKYRTKVNFNGSNARHIEYKILIE